MKNKKPILIGCTFLFALLAIVQALLYLSPTPGDGKVLAHVRFTNIEKITPGTRVTFAGRPVGVVKDIRFLQERASRQNGENQPALYPYELVLQLDSSVQLFPHDEITIHTAGLMGEKSIAILPQPVDKQEKQPITSDTILYGKEPKTLETTLSSFAQLVDKVETTIDTILTAVKTNQEPLTHATHELNTFLTALNTERVPLKFAMLADSGSTCFRSYTALSEQALKGTGSVSKLLSDDSLIQNLDESSRKMSLLLDSIREYGLLFHTNSNYKRAFLQEQNTPHGTDPLLQTLNQAKKNLLQQHCERNHKEVIDSIDTAIRSISKPE